MTRGKIIQINENKSDNNQNLVLRLLQLEPNDYEDTTHK